MSTDPIPAKKLAAIFQDLLSCPPSEAGKRLCSERKLSEHLGIRRKCVQRAFDILVAEGILVRRHGSGTFIRKVPLPRPGKSSRTLFGGRTLSIKDMLAEAAKAPVRKQLLDEHKQLRLYLLTSEQWKGESSNSISTGIKDRAEQEGHLLNVYPFNPDEVAQPTFKPDRLEPCDGCVVLGLQPEIISKVFEEKPTHVVYFGANTREADLLCKPLVRLNLEDAIVRALQLLAAEGFQRIGFIGLVNGDRTISERQLYEKTLADLGLDSPFSTFCCLDHPEAIPEQIKKLFAAKSRPDAVYMADDVLLRHVLPVWESLGLVPGKNLGIISLSTRNNPLPAGPDWSRMEFNPFQVGRLAMDSLLLKIQAAGESICSFEHLAAWLPGSTHRNTRNRIEVKAETLSRKFRPKQDPVRSVASARG